MAFLCAKSLQEGIEVSYVKELIRKRGLVARQVTMPIQYKGIDFDEGFRADIMVEGKVILELKSVETVTPVHKKQVQTYLRLTGCKIGYLLNFGEALMKSGITRCVNDLEEEKQDSRRAVETQGEEKRFFNSYRFLLKYRGKTVWSRESRVRFTTTTSLPDLDFAFCLPRLAGIAWTRKGT